jgi:F-type H+-transporting ATPase subunit b
VKRRIAMALMVVVTGWSLWASAQPKPMVDETARDEREEPPPINWFEFGGRTPPFVATVVNFAILAAGFYVFGRKPIATALQTRRDSIAKEIEEAQKMRREAEARAKIYQAKLERLEEEVRNARRALVDAGEAERDRIVAEAKAKAARMHKDAQFLIEQELKQIRDDLWQDALDMAITAAEGVLQSRVTQADQERLAEEYLADLGVKSKGERPLEPARPAEPGPGNPP